MSKVTIVDYGVGNIRSVRRAFEYAGSEVVLTSNPQEIENASRLVLPGVGAFGHCMEELSKRGLVGAIHTAARNGTPFLGICVGMQIMFSAGEEFGEHYGLDLLAGRVKKIPVENAVLPYIGWAALKKPVESSLLQNTPEGAHVYFLHSYAVCENDPKTIIATYDYEGKSICAAIEKNNLMGVQFHPEKSGEVGIAILKKFLAL